MVLLFINSCKKDTTTSPNNNLTDFIKEAKVFIEQQNTTKLSQKNKLGAELNYIWDKANVFINSDSIKTVEIPLASYKKGYVLGDRNPKAVMASITRLVVKKDKNGELTAFLMTIVPDANYLANKKDDITKNTYHKKTPAFSGLVFYQKQDGTFIEGQRYERGKVMGILTPISDNELNTQVLSKNKKMRYEVADDDCTWYTMWDYTAVCYVSDADIICEWNGEIRWNFKVCSEGGGTVSPIGGGTGTTEFSEIKHQLDSFPCAKALVLQMSTLNSDISNLINNAFGRNDKTNILIKAENSLIGSTIDGRRNGGTQFYNNSGTKTYTFTIELNPDVLLHSTKEYILVTLYHEALHAYIDMKKVELSAIEFESQFSGLYVNNGRLIGVVDEAHWPMGYSRFINGLRDVILAYNPNFNSDRAYALALGGINILSSAQRTINLQERNTSMPGYTGTKCP